MNADSLVGITFTVENEIASGLRFIQVVKLMGVTVDKVSRVVVVVVVVMGYLLGARSLILTLRPRLCSDRTDPKRRLTQRW
jgi:hypothetical protein